MEAPDDQLSLVECSVCLGVLQEPCTLPCGHTFCLACIRQYLQTATRRRCPLCNADVPAGHQLKVSIVTRNLVQALLEKQQQDAAAAVAAVAAMLVPAETATAGASGTSPVIGEEPRPAAASSISSPPRAQKQQRPQQQQQQASASQGLQQQGDEQQQQGDEQQQQQQNEAADQRPPDPGGRQEQPPPPQHPPPSEQQQLSASTPPASPALPTSSSSPKRSILQATLHMAAEAMAVTAQLLLWLLLSETAGRAREAAWVVLAVLLPPALAVWGRSVLWALASAAAAVVLTASRQWRLLALLGGAMAALDAAASLGLVWGQQRSRPAPVPAPW